MTGIDQRSDNSESPTERELQWREYQMGLDLYKFYIDLVLKVVVSYYAITGAILSWYFTTANVPFARWALTLPCVMSFGVATLFRWGAGMWEVVRNNTFRLADELKLSTVFELSALSMLLNGSALLLAATGAALVALIWVR